MEVTAGVASRTFTGDVVRIGRANDNDVVVLDASVSRHHAELRHDGERWELVDLDSRQGTFVDGTRVSRHPLDGPTDVVVGQSPRGEVLHLVPLAPLTTGGEAHARMATHEVQLPLILADPPTRRLHRRRRT